MRKREKALFVSVALLVAVCVLAVPAFAAPATGQMRGRVTDQTGGALPGVSVEVRQGGIVRTATTDAGGNYSVDAIPPGRYDVTYRLINFAPATRRNVAV